MEIHDYVVQTILMLLIIYEVILYFSSEKQHRNEDKRYPQKKLEHFLPTTHFGHNPRRVMKSQIHIYEKAPDKCIKHRMPNIASRHPSTSAEEDMMNSEEHTCKCRMKIWTVMNDSHYQQLCRKAHTENFSETRIIK